LEFTCIKKNLDSRHRPHILYKKKLEMNHRLRDIIYAWNYHNETLYSYLKQTKTSLFEKEGEEGKTCPVWRLVTVGVGGHKERWRRVNVVKILYTHVCKWKNETCWNYLRKGEGGKRRMMEGVNLTKIIL
jgi:hypothetical protein